MLQSVRLVPVLIRAPRSKGPRVSFRSSSTLSKRVESISVPIGGNGTVQLDVQHTTTSSEGRPPRILVHFPSGPSLFTSTPTDDLIKTTQHPDSTSPTSTTVITIKYRLSAPPPSSAKSAETTTFRFPQPIHDTSLAFAHIIDTLIPTLYPPPSKSSPQWPSHLPAQITLTGSHIGAALATTLALTRPNDIHAVTICDPMVDWVILDELCRSSGVVPSSSISRPRRSASTSPAIQQDDSVVLVSAAKSLINIRTKLFATPSAYFDAFASPILFLRAPGRDTPRSHAEALGFLDEDGSVRENSEDYEWEVTGRDDGYWDGSGGDRDQDFTKENVVGSELDLSSYANVEGVEHAINNVPVDSTEKDLDTITEAIGTDSFSFGPYDDDNNPPPRQSSASSPPPSSPTSSSSSDSTTTNVTTSTSPSVPPSDSISSTPSSMESTSEVHPTQDGSARKQIKRRKVLRRWPSSGDPEEVLLPYFNVHVSTAATSDVFEEEDAEAAGLTALLRLQGIELVDLLRRACFYGREKGFGEERVRLYEHVYTSVGDDKPS